MTDHEPATEDTLQSSEGRVAAWLNRPDVMLVVITLLGGVAFIGFTLGIALLIYN